MSNLDQAVQHECAYRDGCDAVRLVIQPRTKELGGFSVRRCLPNERQKMVGPWIFFDHMGPATFRAGEGIDVRPHPHIGIATVTYLFDGEIFHRDSLGSRQAIRPGDLNLMVAGGGIVHSERERDEVRDRPHSAHGLQLWLALPDADEETDPAFFHHPAEELPALTIDGVDVRVMIGSAWGRTSPVKTFSDTLYVEAALPAGKSLDLPPAAERGLYVVSGAVRVGDTALAAHDLAVVNAVGAPKIAAIEDSRIALIGGDAVGPRHIEWNFVSSRPDRIERAKRDWVDGRFPTIPGDNEEFIPLPD